MKAAVFREVDVPLVIEEVQIDSPAAHEVLIRTGASGVCHSDLHYMEGKYYMDTPAILGHEAAGIVEAVGSQVRYVKPGDRVITCLSVFCGECDMCLKGRQVLCRREAGVVREPSEPPRLSLNGTAVTQGMLLASYAEQMLVHEHSVVKVRDDIPFEVLALIGCGVTTGVGAALNTARVEAGSTVAVLGCGGVGLSVVQGARIAGAGRIIAVDTVETKLGMARELGATDVVDASGGDVVEKVMGLTNNRGVDYAFEAVGTKQTSEQAFEMLDDGATAYVLGMVPEGTKIEISADTFLRRERRIQGSTMGSNHFRIDMPRYIDFYLDGRLKVDEMVSQRMKLEQINEAFDDMKQGHVARTVLIFD